MIKTMVFLQTITGFYRKQKHQEKVSIEGEGSKHVEKMGRSCSEVLMEKGIPWRSWIFTPGDHGNYQPAYVPGRIVSNHPPGPTYIYIYT